MNLADCLIQSPVYTNFNNYASRRHNVFAVTDELCVVFNAHIAVTLGSGQEQKKDFYSLDAE